MLQLLTSEDPAFLLSTKVVPRIALGVRRVTDPILYILIVLFSRFHCWRERRSLAVKNRLDHAEGVINLDSICGSVGVLTS